MKAIFKREFKSYFLTPLGSIILAVYYMFLGLFFSYSYSYGSSDIASLIMSMSIIVMFSVPAITMRSFSDDRRQRVDQVLFTAPVKLSSIVLGKFFAAMCLYALCFLPTVIFEIIILVLVNVSIVPYLYSLFGILLFGGALVSIGMFVSSLTESVVVSAVITLIINIAAIYTKSLAAMIGVDFITKIASKIAFVEIAETFATPVFSIPNVVFFVSIIAAALFLCGMTLEKRRWS